MKPSRAMQYTAMTLRRSSGALWTSDQMRLPAPRSLSPNHHHLESVQESDEVPHLCTRVIVCTSTEPAVSISLGILSSLALVFVFVAMIGQPQPNTIRPPKILESSEKLPLSPDNSPFTMQMFTPAKSVPRRSVEYYPPHSPYIRSIPEEFLILLCDPQTTTRLATLQVRRSQHF